MSEKLETSPAQFRTDRHNNPTAFTVTVAEQAHLVPAVDYEPGDSFRTILGLAYTARLIGDPVALTIRVIDRVGFRTSGGVARWMYIELPQFVWSALSSDLKRDVIGWMYEREGGTAMRELFPNYGRA